MREVAQTSALKGRGLGRRGTPILESARLKRLKRHAVDMGSASTAAHFLNSLALEAVLSDSKDERRYEFTPATKLAIAKRAGGLCSFRDCLAPTFSDDGNLDVDGPIQKATSAGKACHIYSAAKKGPRRRDGKSEEFIRSANNGFWACGTCHDSIDTVASIYKAETLLEMKLVRETAQRIARHHPMVRSVVGRAGFQMLDNLVWESKTRGDTDKIAKQYLVLAEQVAVFVRSLVTTTASQLQSPPSAPMQLQSSIRDAALSVHLQGRSTSGIKPQLPVARTLTDAQNRERLITLVKGWCEGQVNKVVQKIVRGHLFIRSTSSDLDNLVCHVDTRTISIQLQSGEEGTHIDHYQFDVFGFEKPLAWLSLSLRAEIADSGFREKTNFIRIKGLPCPVSTRDCGWVPAIQTASELLKCLLGGGQPYLRLSAVGVLERGDPSKQVMHPDEFDLALMSSNHEIETALHQIEMVLVCYELSAEFRLPIVFRSDPLSRAGRDPLDQIQFGFACPELTVEAMREGISQILRKIKNESISRSGIWSTPLVEAVVNGVSHFVLAHYDGAELSFCRVHSDIYTRSATLYR